MGLFVLHAEGKAAECSVGVGGGREGGERLWGRVKVEIVATTLRETRSPVHHVGVSESPCSSVSAKRLVFHSNEILVYDLPSLV